MFMVFNKDKILSYLISISTVTLLFVMSFAITQKNEEILETSTNELYSNNNEEKSILKEDEKEQVDTQETSTQNEVLQEENTKETNSRPNKDNGAKN